MARVHGGNPGRYLRRYVHEHVSAIRLGYVNDEGTTMARILFTGDRSFSPIYPGMVVMDLLRAVVAGDEILTGINDGVEQIVRDVAENVGLHVTVLPQGQLPNGKPDFDSRHKALPSDVHVRVYHVEPMASSVVASALTHVPDARVEILTPAELLG